MLEIFATSSFGVNAFRTRLVLRRAVQDVLALRLCGFVISTGLVFHRAMSAQDSIGTKQGVYESVPPTQEGGVPFMQESVGVPLTQLELAHDDPPLGASTSEVIVGQ